jgi:hypothetical protein
MVLISALGATHPLPASTALMPFLIHNCSCSTCYSDVNILARFNRIPQFM